MTTDIDAQTQARMQARAARPHPAQLGRPHAFADVMREAAGRDYGAEIDALSETDKGHQWAIEAIDTKLDEHIARAGASLAAMQARLDADASGGRDFLQRLTSRKFLLAVFGPPIAWAAAKWGVDPELIVGGIVLLATFILGESAVDAATAQKGHEPAPAPVAPPRHID